MKKYLILLLAVTTIFAKKNKDFVFPENITVNENKTEVIGTYKVDLTKDEIYAKTLEWLALNIKDSKFSIELQDKENHKIIGHFSLSGIKDFGAYRYGDIDYLIESKDGRCRINLQNVRIVQEPGGAVYCSGISKMRGNRKYFLKLWNRDFAQIILNTLEDLHNYLETQTKKTDDDW